MTVRPADRPTVKISKTAKECLEITAITGTIVAAGGGYWVSSHATEQQRRELVQGIRTASASVPHVGTRTVYSCEALGLLKRGDGWQHKAPRILTENGRAVLTDLVDSAR